MKYIECFLSKKTLCNEHVIICTSTPLNAIKYGKLELVVYLVRVYLKNEEVWGEASLYRVWLGHPLGIDVQLKREKITLIPH